MTIPTKRDGRDGVWTVNGLAADFRYIRAHPNCDGIHLIETAGGEHYVPESELRWDCAPMKTA